MSGNRSLRQVRPDRSSGGVPPTASRRVSGEEGLWQHGIPASQFGWTTLFTAVQAWAVIVVLTQLRADGVVRTALACVLSGVVMSIILAWQRARCCRRDGGDKSAAQ